MMTMPGCWSLPLLLADRLLVALTEPLHLSKTPPPSPRLQCCSWTSCSQIGFGVGEEAQGQLLLVAVLYDSVDVVAVVVAVVVDVNAD